MYSCKSKSALPFRLGTKQEGGHDVKNGERQVNSSVAFTFHRGLEFPIAVVRDARWAAEPFGA
jgi:hypothetical protein